RPPADPGAVKYHSSTLRGRFTAERTSLFQEDRMIIAPHAAAPRGKKPFYKHLYVQVLTAIVAGIVLGHFYPQIGKELKPLGEAFIKLVKMIIAPVIFLTVVTGIAG